MDPRVLGALRHLELLVDEVTLARPEDKADVIFACKTLLHDGCGYDPGEMEAWARAHGWKPGAVAHLGTWARGVLDDRRFRLTRAARIAEPRSKAIARWRKLAEEPEI